MMTAISTLTHTALLISWFQKPMMMAAAEISEHSVAADEYQFCSLGAQVSE
jgi:hypothetical protein